MRAPYIKRLRRSIRIDGDRWRDLETSVERAARANGTTGQPIPAGLLEVDEGCLPIGSPIERGGAATSTDQLMDLGVRGAPLMRHRMVFS